VNTDKFDRISISTYPQPLIMSSPTIGQQLLQLKSLIQKATGSACDTDYQDVQHVQDLLVSAGPLLTHVQHLQHIDNIRCNNLFNAGPLLAQVQMIKSVKNQHEWRRDREEERVSPS
jgi:hypothetical protein